MSSLSPHLRLHQTTLVQNPKFCSYYNTQEGGLVISEDEHSITSYRVCFCREPSSALAEESRSPFVDSSICENPGES